MIRPPAPMVPPVPPIPAELPPGVGIPAGVSPLEHLRSVVKDLLPGWGPRRPLILTHRTPDPDALGAMFGLELLLRRALSLDPEIAATGRISRAENVAMLRELDLAFVDAEALDRTRYAAVFLVDTQPGFGHTPLPDGIPVVAVFDHHRPPDPEALRGRELPPHYDLRLEVGATSALMYGYLREARIELERAEQGVFCLFELVEAPLCFANSGKHIGSKLGLALCRLFVPHGCLSPLLFSFTALPHSPVTVVRFRRDLHRLRKRLASGNVLAFTFVEISEAFRDVAVHAIWIETDGFLIPELRDREAFRGCIGVADVEIGSILPCFVNGHGTLRQDLQVEAWICRDARHAPARDLGQRVFRQEPAPVRL